LTHYQNIPVTETETLTEYQKDIVTSTEFQTTTVVKTAEASTFYSTLEKTKTLKPVTITSTHSVTSTKTSTSTVTSTKLKPTTVQDIQEITTTEVVFSTIVDQLTHTVTDTAEVTEFVTTKEVVTSTKPVFITKTEIVDKPIFVTKTETVDKVITKNAIEFITSTEVVIQTKPIFVTKTDKPETITKTISVTKTVPFEFAKTLYEGNAVEIGKKEQKEINVHKLSDSFDCGDKICHLHYELKENCLVYIETNVSNCKIPCDVTGCKYHFIQGNCPFWKCYEKPVPINPPNPEPEPLPIFCHSAFCYTSIALNLLLLLILSILIFFIHKLKQYRPAFTDDNIDSDPNERTPIFRYQNQAFQECSNVGPILRNQTYQSTSVQSTSGQSTSGPKSVLTGKTKVLHKKHFSTKPTISNPLPPLTLYTIASSSSENSPPIMTQCKMSTKPSTSFSQFRLPDQKQNTNEFVMTLRSSIKKQSDQSALMKSLNESEVEDESNV